MELEVISAIPAKRFTPQGRARLGPDIKSLMLRLRKRQGKLRRVLPIFFFFVSIIPRQRQLVADESVMDFKILKEELGETK